MVNAKGRPGLPLLPEGKDEKRVFAMGVAGTVAFAGLGVGFGLFQWRAWEAGTWDEIGHAFFFGGAAFVFALGAFVRASVLGRRASGGGLYGVVVEAGASGVMSVAAFGLGIVFGVLAAGICEARSVGAAEVAGQAGSLLLAASLALLVVGALCGWMRVLAWRRKQEAS